MPLLLAAVALSIAACAGGPPMPTPTAIPLDATATATARPAHQEPTASTPEPTSMAVPATETPAFGSASRPSALDDLLAHRTVEDFLARLTRAGFASAADLYLTDGAQENNVEQVLEESTSGGRTLVKATLTGFGAAPASGYEARAELQWSGTDDSSPVTQTMMLHLVYERGLWLIDDISLGEAQPQEISPPPAAQKSPRRASSPPPLEGRFVFQVSSGGEIYRINADGSGLRRLTDGLDPAWSPDGTRIALTRWRNPWGVYLIRADGSGEERVVDGQRFKEVAWSPDGSRIAFTLNRGSSEPIKVCFFGFCFTIPPFSAAQLWVADLDSGDYLSLPLDDQAVHSPTWSPDGSRIVYAGQTGLAWIDLDSMGTGRFAGSAWDGSPAYSPSGRQLAFMGRVHNRWDIFVMNADGSGRRQLTDSDPRLDDPPHNVAPAWSPDGSQIAFLSDRDGRWRIYVMQADGSDPRAMFGDELDGLGLSYDWASERVLSWTE